ncbi:hypothetical protein NDU88_005672 [Pleurodeles waltl]|uniref:Uncharacterized protein n=1 Tax=Pleurodeles waltl TaxID=8319 RepID=A0AAV7UJW7_PLEWA|nr:hypothetical protein NDU88_005672 [Pleurodeles waltl]
MLPLRASRGGIVSATLAAGRIRLPQTGGRLFKSPPRKACPSSSSAAAGFEWKPEVVVLRLRRPGIVRGSSAGLVWNSFFSSSMAVGAPLLPGPGSGAVIIGLVPWAASLNPLTHNSIQAYVTIRYVALC